MTSGRKRAGSRSSSSRKTPSRGDLAERLAVGGARHRHRHRAAGAVTGEPDHAHVVAEVLAAELGTDPGGLGEMQHLAFELDVAERVPRHRSGGREGVEIFGRRQLRRLHRELRRRPAHHDRQVVRRAGRRAERLHLLEQPRQQPGLVEQRLRLLVQVALVGAAAAFGDEQELVLVAVGGGDLDLGREVVVGVALVVHRDRCHLAVAQVARLIRLEHAAGDGLFVAATGEDPLPFLRLDDRGPGVLAHREHAAGRDRRVLQQVHGDEPIVVARLGVVDDRPHLAEMSRAEIVGDVVHRLGGEPGQGARLDLEERALGGVERRHALGRHQPVGGRRPVRAATAP